MIHARGARRAARLYPVPAKAWMASARRRFQAVIAVAVGQTQDPQTSRSTIAYMVCVS